LARDWLRRYSGLALGHHQNIQATAWTAGRLIPTAGQRETVHRSTQRSDVELVSIHSRCGGTGVSIHAMASGLRYWNPAGQRSQADIKVLDRSRRLRVDDIGRCRFPNPASRGGRTPSGRPRHSRRHQARQLVWRFRWSGTCPRGHTSQVDRRRIVADLVSASKPGRPRRRRAS
jgi:hypothetical protein